MRAGWFERLTEVMAAMAAGDPAAVGELLADFGDPIRNAVRGHFRSLGVTWATDDDVEAVTVDFCVELRRRARSWDPSHGATPWKWCERRLRSMAAGHAGQFSDPLPDDGPAEPVAASVAACLDSDDVLDAFCRLAAVREDMRLLHEALQRVSRTSQQAILFETRMQADQGDPSPALTVGNAYGVKADSVRQTCKRVTDRVRRLAAEDPYFAPLAELPFLQRAA